MIGSMALVPNSSTRKVRGLSEADRIRIRDFLQGAVYCWCKNRKKEWFALRDLMGGDNFFWQGTPMIALWKKHKGKTADPVKEAAKDGGWLLKRVIVDDRRKFETKQEGLVRHYRWTGDDGVDEEE